MTFTDCDNCVNCQKLTEKIQMLVDLGFEGAILAENVLNYRFVYRCENRSNGDFEAQEEREMALQATE